MATITPIHLDPAGTLTGTGKQITVAAVASTGTTIHKSVTGTTSFDKITLYATNIDTVSIVLTIQWGGTAAGDETKISIPAQAGKTLVIDAERLNNALFVYAYAGTANKILISGTVDRYVP